MIRLAPVRRSPRRRLTNAQVADVLARLMDGEYEHEIAAAFGMPQSCIHDIKSGRHYRNVPRPPGFAQAVRRYGRGFHNCRNTHYEDRTKRKDNAQCQNAPNTPT